MQNAVLDSWGAYNQRRYGCPWVCVMRADGSYNFEPRVGTYTGNARQGEGGDLVVFEPVVGQVYGLRSERLSEQQVDGLLCKMGRLRLRPL